jgi:hypothetical protein
MAIHDVLDEHGEQLTLDVLPAGLAGFLPQVDLEVHHIEAVGAQLEDAFASGTGADLEDHEQPVEVRVVATGPGNAGDLLELLGGQTSTLGALGSSRRGDRLGTFEACFESQARVFVHAAQSVVVLLDGVVAAGTALGSADLSPPCVAAQLTSLGSCPDPVPHDVSLLVDGADDHRAEDRAALEAAGGDEVG